MSTIPAFFAICCFFAFLLELHRLRRQPKAWVRTELCLLGLGLMLLTAFLTWRVFHSGRLPLSSPQDAIFVLVWVLAGASMEMVSGKRSRNAGIFVLPMVLVLLGIGIFAANDTPFALRPASLAWGIVHGLSMLFAAVAIFSGFLSGTLYLHQIRRLKQPRLSAKPKLRIPFPPLERLHKTNLNSTKFAALMLALGVLSGVVMDVLRSDSVNLLANWMILGTLALLFWFVFSLFLGFFWKRANAGPQIAYRTILNFAALCTLFGLVIFSQHRVFPDSISLESEFQEETSVTDSVPASGVEADSKNETEAGTETELEVSPKEEPEVNSKVSPEANSDTQILPGEKSSEPKSEISEETEGQS